MAYGGSQNWELLCPVCKTFIESNNDLDLQSSLDNHYSKVHPSLKNISQSNKQVSLLKIKNVHQPSKECTHYIICPVCENVVEIFQNNINHWFMEHFEICHQFIAKLDDTDDVAIQRRIGESKKIFPNSEKQNDMLDLNNVQAKSQSSDLIDLPPDLEKHSGYIIFKNNRYHCHICRQTLTQEILEDHLKTKRHEDNVITWLQDKLPNHMNGVMEFVSFYGSNLGCNLCRCNIDLNSNNCHETLFNIVSHNTDPKHSRSKSHREMRQDDFSCSVIQSVMEKNTLINEHRDYIELEMEPHLKCKLCDKIINFNKNVFDLEQNFLTHINSILHKTNSKAMTVLKFFRELNGDKDRKHDFFVLNGLINCSECKCTIIANVDLLLEHCQGTITVGNSQSSENENRGCALESSTKPPAMIEKNNSSSDRKLITKFTCRTQNSMTLSDLQPSSSLVVPTDTSKAKEIKRPDIKGILHPLNKQYGNIICIAENADGNLTCLICNCTIQPTTHFVRMHIMGKFHKNKTQCQIKELNTLNINGETHQVNLNSIEKSNRVSYQDLLEHLFQSIPQRFQSEKDFFTINLTDGSINCVLCGCVIDPVFMQTHLQDQAHIQQRKLKGS